MSLKTRIARSLYFFRSSSKPYISGDGIRKVIPFRIEGKKPKYKRTHGCVVFCESDHVEQFMKMELERPGKEFVLVSGNGDINFEKSIMEIAPKNMKHWYGQNILFKNERVTPFPIGLENRYYENSGNVRLIEKINACVSRKELSIFAAFNTDTNKQERLPAMAAAQQNELCKVSLKRIPVADFQLQMASCKFTMSPPGNGFDCHRTWEAMYYRSVPIVKRSAWSEYYISLDLPMLAVSDWFDPRLKDASFLEQWYAQNEHKFSSPVLWLQYWEMRIISGSKES